MPPRQHAPRPASDAEHSIVYRREDAFCGWPFYCGLWRVANGDLVAGFKKIPLAYRDMAEISHDRLTYRQGDLYLIRSVDNGRTWNGDELTHVHPLDIGADEILARGARDYRAEGPLEFASPDTLIMTGAVPAFLKPDSQPWLRASTDGGRTWRRHILLPMGGFPALSGCGSSLTRSDGMNLIGLAMTTEDGWANRPLVYASRDGIDWHFLSFIGTEDGTTFVSTRQGSFIFGAIGRFYPRLIELSDGTILAAVRAQRDARNVIWTELYRSADGGLTWTFLSRITDWGAPGDLAQLSDGRIVCVYGYRVRPPGLRARISEDSGATWGGDIVLRNDGGSWDLGYPRIIEHEPNRLLALYYMNLANEPVRTKGGVRHIAQTTFTPD
ncbi:sialidase family protein [Psychromarinibacter sp. C21-152]|uniref:Sialidase family protein n=1 Tax=Psychromarinibacter sediminicola TaxID=3033385 RepID=A0AAE3TA14_9RHOB|nr:sialidase family protein [Psychromarinibacter sediminicola]MDF0601135.1 sialidase family protein [Psychromarinibacter sediminicola]